MKKLFLALAVVGGLLLAGGCENPTKSSPSGGSTAVTFQSLTADGSAMAATTKLTLIFDKDITGLAVTDITLTANNTGAQKGVLAKTGTGVYDLTLAGITATGDVYVSVVKSGYIISGSSKKAKVYYYDDPNAVAVTFNSLTADGSATATTTKLTLTFDKDITGLAVMDITLNAGSTGAQKGTLTKASGTGVYELTLTGITATGNVSVTVTKSGYTVSGSKTAQVFYYSAPAVTVTFNSLTADGSATASTTKLTLTFNTDIANLAATDITLTPNSTGVQKGTLTKASGTGVYDLALTGITATGNISVSVTKTGYTISGGPKTAQVFYYYNPGSASITTLTFAQITEAAPAITGPVLYRYTNNGPTSATLTVDNPSQYSSISWRVDTTTGTGTGASFTLNAGNTAYNAIAEHFVTLTVIKDGVPYNKTVSFTVVY
jgi:hypothetical protein